MLTIFRQNVNMLCRKIFRFRSDWIVKIAFSTVGCPEWSWGDIYIMAKDLGFNGIELRGLENEMDLTRARPFTDAHLDKTTANLKKLNLAISCLASSCYLGGTDDEDKALEEGFKYIDLASKLNCKYIRILGDLNPDPRGEIDDERVIRLLLRLAPKAEEKNVCLLVETSGVYAKSSRLKKIIESVDSEYVQVLWDIHHPYRFFNESPNETVRNIGKYTKYVHIKDSVMNEDGTVSYKILGDGDLPVVEILDLLKSTCDVDYVSLEWVKRWNKNLVDAAVVFPAFVNFMADYNAKDTYSLYDNKTKTGKFPWPKEHLIDCTFPDVLDRICEEFPDQYAFRYTELDYTRTYPEFREDVYTFARSLISMGVKKGDHVAIWATNVPAWYITFWATTLIGAVLVTVNTAYKVHEAEYLLRQSDTHTLVMVDKCKDSDYIEIIKSLCPELETSEPGQLKSKKLPFLKNIITVDSKQKGCFSWDEAIKLSENTSMDEVLARRAKVDKHDVCNMQYTSGTTGFPKGVMLTHYNVVNNGKAIGDCMDLSTSDRMMIQVPMFHCFGMVLAMTASVTHGVTMSPMPMFSPRKSLACINKEKITVFHGVPTMFIAMLGHEDFDKTDFSHIRTGIMAGSPCPIKVMEDVINKMNMKEICITYGQTEASPACTNSWTDDPIDVRVNTVGRALFGVKCKIVDPETGEDLPDNVDGEFVAKGYNIMRGYYKMPEATEAAIDENGWLHTGDLARRLPDGNFKITGRIKDMIIRGGENIYPKEIEDFIYTHDKVQDVQVIGVPSEQYGEEIMACVILKPGVESSEEEIKKYVLDHMAKHKVPSYVAFVEEFPMNAAGKILKYKMREWAVELLNLHKANSIETA